MKGSSLESATHNCLVSPFHGGADQVTGLRVLGVDAAWQPSRAGDELRRALRRECRQSRALLIALLPNRVGGVDRSGDPAENILTVDFKEQRVTAAPLRLQFDVDPLLRGPVARP